MQKPDPLNINKNFKVSATVDAAIDDYSSEASITPSDFIRRSTYFFGPLLTACPEIKNLNRRELEELAANIGNTLVIRKVSVEWAGSSGGDGRY